MGGQRSTCSRPGFSQQPEHERHHMCVGAEAGPRRIPLRVLLGLVKFVICRGQDWKPKGVKLPFLLISGRSWLFRTSCGAIQNGAKPLN